MLINEKMYKRFKDSVENDLEVYPFYLMAIETPGLGSPNNWSEVKHKGVNPPDPVAGSVISSEHKHRLVNAINFVFDDKLDEKSQKIIRAYYFEGNVVKPSEVMEELKINKTRYYELRKIALYKFMLGLGYC